MSDFDRLDDDGHVAALGEWCDCVRCVLQREGERAALLAKPVPTIAQLLVEREHDRYRERLRSGELDLYAHRDPVHLGTFGGQVEQQHRHLGRVVLVVVALATGCLLAVLLQAGGA